MMRPQGVKRPRDDLRSSSLNLPDCRTSREEEGCRNLVISPANQARLLLRLAILLLSCAGMAEDACTPSGFRTWTSDMVAAETAPHAGPVVLSLNLSSL
jgi:hypothetical protein